MQIRPLPSRHLAGVEVRLDASVLVLVALVAWAFTGIFRADHELLVALAMAMLGSLLVVLTTLAHELGHALEARHRGMQVEAVTLLLFGGVTEMHAEDQTARDELAVAMVGPWISLVSAALFGLVATFADQLLPTSVSASVGQLAGVLGWWNLLLAAFNLVPGAPLDGGRVLRALLWMLLGDRLRALRVSVRAGQLIGGALVAFGVATLVRGGARASLVAAALVLSGLFLVRAAAAELRHAELNAALEGRRVVELLALPPTSVVPGEATAHRPPPPPVGGAPTPDPAVPAVTVDDDLHTLIEAFQGDHDVVHIMSDGRQVGSLSAAEVARAVARLRRGEPLP
ncbi:MAG: site-2 protease family protein [Nitriliruptoraceae bacterium]